VNINNVKSGLRVRTGDLEPTKGLLATNKEQRREGAIGTVLKTVHATGPPFWWWVEHDDDSIAPYTIHELEPLEDQSPRLKPLGSPKVKVDSKIP